MDLSIIVRNCALNNCVRPPCARPHYQWEFNWIQVEWQFRSEKTSHRLLWNKKCKIVGLLSTFYLNEMSCSSYRYSETCVEFFVVIWATDEKKIVEIFQKLKLPRLLDLKISVNCRFFSSLEKISHTIILSYTSAFIYFLYLFTS